MLQAYETVKEVETKIDEYDLMTEGEQVPIMEVTKAAINNLEAERIRPKGKAGLMKKKI